MRSSVFLLTLTAGLLGLGLLSAGRLPAAPADASTAAWPFTPPRKPALPEVQHRDRIANTIDAFALAKLEARGLSLNEPADKLTLLRRVTLDLTGLPSTVEEQDAFLADNTTEAYVRVVDRLLASQRY